MALYQVRRCDKGYGLFAKQSIPRGTRIFAERALVGYTCRDGPLEGEEEYEILWGEFVKLLQDPPRHARYIRLAGDPDIDIGRALRDFIENKCYSKTTLKLPGRKALRSGELYDAMMHMFAVFYTNSAGKGEGAKYGAGTFPKYSRINHSCTPNIANSWNRTSDRMIVHANRDIQADEEILSSYIDFMQIEAERRADLEHWGFRCECEACSDSSAADIHESRRRQYCDILLGLQIYEAAGSMNNDEAFSLSTQPPECIPQNDMEAFNLAKDLLELVTEMDMIDKPIRKAYRACSKFGLRLGLLDEAAQYADKDLEAEEICLGDNVDSLEDAACKFWVAELRSHAVGAFEQPRLYQALARPLVEKSDG